MQTEIVKDLPMGILLMVISQFFLVGVNYLIKTEYWFTLISIVFLSVLYWKFFSVGWRVAFNGIEVDVTEDQ